MDPKVGGGFGGEEDDCVDSGAETGGSDYSHMSSASSDLSVEEAQDPFLVSIHIIADPGESQHLQEAIGKVLAWIHPDLQLFRVSERRACRRRKKVPKAAQPALAVVLFLQEEYGEEQILQLHGTLQRPPWHFHHTERVHGRFLPYLPCSQDFFTLAPGTPLWAIRPVHYGKEIVRFTIYCRHENYTDILKFYELILRRSPSQRKTDFCIFPIFSNLDVDVQFSLKRLPCDQTPVPTDSSVLEFRVRDIGELVPLLPNPCSPISEGRWQTEDHDGNKILLQAQRAHKKVLKPSRAHHSEEKKSPVSSPSSTAPAPAGLPHGNQQGFTRRVASPPSHPWSFQRSKSLFCLPLGGPSPGSIAEPQSLPSTGPLGHRAAEWRHGQLLSIDDLEGAQETDVDTGLRLSSSDLSVVSAYSAPSRFCSSVETHHPSDTGGSCWPSHKDSREGLLPTVSTMTPEHSGSSLPFFTKGSSSSSVASVTVSSFTESSQEPSCDISSRDIPPPPALAGPGDGEMEEFYI
ncbi:PREDICTED: protein FAM124A-like [Chrysochloris asiatica]|uniref:Protein FAM124A-like n=1 Tax=Chrysochloris asiatica TaxID=185453 RepID=A0A9B0U1T4_CHRAS|nr:PREDICTED: protein FAM124A-like [Chrysochloris asiatica]